MSDSEQEYEDDVCPIVQLETRQQRERAKVLSGLFDQVAVGKLTMQAARVRLYKLRSTQKREIWSARRLLAEL